MLNICRSSPIRAQQRHEQRASGGASLRECARLLRSVPIRPFCAGAQFALLDVHRSTAGKSAALESSSIQHHGAERCARAAPGVRGHRDGQRGATATRASWPRSTRRMRACSTPQPSTCTTRSRSTAGSWLRAFLATSRRALRSVLQVSKGCSVLFWNCSTIQHSHNNSHSNNARRPQGARCALCSRPRAVQCFGTVPWYSIATVA